MTTIWMLGLLVSVIGVAVLTWWLLKRGPRVQPMPPNPFADESLPEAATEPDITTDEAAEERLTRARVMIQALLTDTAAGITTMAGEAQTYSDALSGHRNTIEDAESLTALQEVERLLLRELDEMKAVTDHYRTQLEAARQTIRAQQEAMLRMKEEAGLDTLLRVPNRGAFDERIQEEVARSDRYKAPMSLVMFDVDHFKEVNDTYGHVVGDRVLQGVVQVLREQCRQHDFLARYGGEEFVMILPQSDLRAARLMADRTRRRVSGCRFVHNGVSISVTCSAGLAQLEAGMESAEALVTRTDAALYAAKSQGRNCVVAAPHTRDSATGTDASS